jgi:hypothetical protein
VQWGAAVHRDGVGVDLPEKSRPAIWTSWKSPSGAARVLRLAGSSGEIAVGRSADLITVDLDVPHLDGFGDPALAVSPGRTARRGHGDRRGPGAQVRRRTARAATGPGP